MLRVTYRASRQVEVYFDGHVARFYITIHVSIKGKNLIVLRFAHCVEYYKVRMCLCVSLL